MNQENNQVCYSKDESIHNERIFENTDIIKQLSNQLEYYFSPQNIANDTYMKSVMQMNSGYVPISILLNFANVKKIISRFYEGSEFSSLDLNRLLQTSALASSNLKIVVLDAQGKFLDNHVEPHSQLNDSSNILGIGSTLSSNSGSKLCPDTLKANSNIVILREVPEDATEEDVKNIFVDENGYGPNVESIKKEIGRCWFVHFSSDIDKPSLISLLLDLRNKTVCGAPVQARLKTHTSIARSTDPYRSYGRESVPRYNYYPNDADTKTDNKTAQVKTYNEKSYSRPKTKVGLDRGVGKNEKTVTKVPPPDLGEGQFPGLSSVKVSETKTQVQTVSGYASALLKVPPKIQKSPSNKSQNRRAEDDASKNKNDDAKSTTSVSSTDDSSASSKSEVVSKSNKPITTTPPAMAWGGRSFADIVKA